MLGRQVYEWKFQAAAPPREVFAVMEQMLGIPPFRYEVVSEHEARIVEHERKGFFGTWTKRMVRPVQWVRCRAEVTEAGTSVTLSCSRRSRIGGRDPAPMRAMQLVKLLTRGTTDVRTIYRQRDIPAGPISLVASWAGTPYRLYAEPRWDAERTETIRTARPIDATGRELGPFVEVKLETGTVGWVEKDQVVAAPEESTRRANLEAARFV